MKQIEFGAKHYFKPTPGKLRILGDTVLAVSLIGAVFVPGAKWVIIAGILGKYLTNFSKTN